MADNTAYWYTIYLGLGQHGFLCFSHLWEVDRLCTDVQDIWGMWSRRSSMFSFEGETHPHVFLPTLVNMFSIRLAVVQRHLSLFLSAAVEFRPFGLLPLRLDLLLKWSILMVFL